MMALLSELAAHQALILHDLLRHIELVFTAALIGTLIALPLGIVLSRRPKVAEPVITVVGMIQTVPSLALLAIVLPILGIGFRPAVAALALYALLPILRNTYAGLRSVRPEVVDCAIAMGMSPRQSLWRVQMPLAVPVIIAGIRLSTVYLVSWAVLASLIGAGGLGNLIFEGMSTYDVGLIIAGAVPAALMAVLLGLLFTALERWLTPQGLRIRAGEEAAA